MPKGTLRLIIAAAIFLATITTLSHLGNTTDIVQLTKQASLLYIALAFITHALYVIFQAELIGSLFSMVGVSLLLIELLTFYIAAEFANFILPTAGLSGLTVFAAEAKKHNINDSIALTISALSYYFNYLTFSIFLGLGLIFLAKHDQLNSVFVAPSIIMGGIILIGSLVVWSASQGPRGLKRIFSWTIWIFDHISIIIRDKKIFSSQKIHSLSSGIHKTVSGLLDQKTALWKPLIWGFLIHGANIVTLEFTFLAFHYPVNFGVVVTGYAIGWLATIVSITPLGVGFVEGAMTLVFRSLGVPIEVAILVTTLYRAIVFWVSFIFGAVAFRKLKILNGVE